jgi:transposase InsO family protein
MVPRPASTIPQRLEVVHLKVSLGYTHRQAATALGYSRSWARKWVRRSRRGGLVGLQPTAARLAHPLVRFSPAVAAAARAYRSSHPLVGARRVVVELEQDPALQGQRLPDARTLHRFFVAAGLVRRRVPPDQLPPPAPPGPPAEPHAVWQIDHQDHLRLAGLAELSVLQSIRAPRVGLTIGADLFAGPHGAHAVAADALLDALRRHLARWGRPRWIQVDHAPGFLGRPQRQFPSRFELFCAGLGIGVVPIRPGRPTDNGAVERLHYTLDAVLLGPHFVDRGHAQRSLDAHIETLNTRFPSRARGCQGQPPLVAHPYARHSGRPYAPAREWTTFDLDAVDRLLAGWRWYRQVGKSTPQISFGHLNLHLGAAYAGQVVALHFDPTDRQVVVCTLGPTKDLDGPEIRRFRCPAFEKVTILGSSLLTGRPSSAPEAIAQ